MKLISRRKYVIKVLTIVVFLSLMFTFHANCQTKWFKYDGNPVLDVGPKDSWEDEAATAHRIIVRNSIYHMWYAGLDGAHARMGYATSRNGIIWKKHPSNPVLDVNAKSWDHVKAYFGYVSFTGSKYEMWYVGGPGIQVRIGYATSSDGIHWTKADSENPVIDFDTSRVWHKVGFASPSVWGPDSDGVLKMWYHAIPPSSGIQIGYAIAKDPVSWTRHPEPVVALGFPGTWDELRVGYPRVLHDGESYKMWYSGGKGPTSTFRIGHANSPDGIQWAKSFENPVVSVGAAGSWEDWGVWIGDVIFDKNMYYMWYTGHDESKGRTGFAVSPKGTVVDISPSSSYLQSGALVRIAVKVAHPSGLSFSAAIKAPPRGKYFPGLFGQEELQRIDEVSLFDDGAHADALSGDGIFANTWVPKDENVFIVDIRMKVRQRKEMLEFTMENAGAFTTVGPIRFDSMQFVGNPKPNPGDTVLIKLTLRNDGAMVTPTEISASLSAADSFITSISGISPWYGSISSGSTAITSGYYRVFISPDCPHDTDVKLNVSISSLGVPLWRDTFTIRVLPPWWRTNWAYGLLGVIAAVVAYALRRLETNRLRLKHQREMEHFQVEKLRELDQLKSRFFANISHEFRTPLTLIQGPADQIASGQEKEDPRKLAEMISRNSKRLLRLVNQMLDLSKIESGQLKLKVRRTDIVELVKGTAASFESLAAQKGIRFSVESQETSVVGWSDCDAVEKILTNLLSNAFKFTPFGGEVKVTVGRRVSSTYNAEVEIHVSDSGMGIPASKIDKIFDRFYQVDDTQTKEHEGSGIGLALSKELVELHKGTIEVQSIEGQGSAFVVRLPLSKDQYRPEDFAEASVEEQKKEIELRTTRASEAPADVEWNEEDETHPLVLVVEDNADMRHYIQTHLKETCRTLEAANGVEGVSKAIETVPDLIISDVMMPKMDGFEVCRRLKTDERTSHIPVILLTAKAGSESKIEGLEKGADDYLIKPFGAKELQVRVKNLIEQRKGLREKFRKEGTFKLKEIAITSADERFLKRVMDIVEEHIPDQAFTTDVFAKEIFMSRMQLHRKIRSLTDFSPAEFVRRIRLVRASQLLQRMVGTIAEIAYQVGYEDPSRFADAFRNQFGILPSEFIKRQETQM